MAGKPEGAVSSPNIHQRILAITQELGAIEKTGQADPRMGGYEFIEHAQIMGRLRTLLVKHGVTIIPSMRVAGREAVPREGGKVAHRVTGDLTLTVINADRPEDRFTIEWPGEALDNQDKATQKAGTSAEKYALMKLFKISDREDPGGALVGDEDEPRPAQRTAPPARPSARASRHNGGEGGAEREARQLARWLADQGDNTWFEAKLTAYASRFGWPKALEEIQRHVSQIQGGEIRHQAEDDLVEVEG